MNELSDFWWNALRHEGLLLDQVRLGELQAFFEKKPLPVDWLFEKLRLKISQSGEVSELLELVLEKICGFGHCFIVRKGSEVPAAWSCVIPGLRENIKPSWLYTKGEQVVLAVFVDRTEARRLGQGRSRVFHSKVLRWQRTFRQPLALVTNGRQWRLSYATADHEATCEWDGESWFANGAPSPELRGFLMLFSPEIWQCGEGGASRLLQAVQDSRKGQNELSGQMGERVRQAVELLIREHSEALNGLGSSVDGQSIYMAGVRMVMRLVVLFFAESREGLLPKDNAIYNQGYSLGNLIQQLKRHRGSKDVLASSYQAWPRLLALMKLLYMGSSHEAMPVAAYGGQLFAPGDVDSADMVSRVIALFENEYRNQDRPVMSDAAVLEMLTLLAESKVRIRQQRQFITVPMPIDFSSLGNEYIGILFESLLNFELKQAEASNPVVFVNVGDQPALPLNHLEQMSDKEISDMFKAMKEAAKKAASGDSSGEAEAETMPSEEVEEEPEELPDETKVEAEVDGDEEDEIDAVRSRALEWAARACRVTGIVRAPKKLNQATRVQYEENLAREAKKLVPIIVEPGQWYLVRWGGTRKGSGTFYTKPQLAIPTVERTLSPLVHTSSGTWQSPEVIEALRICDPACGSGSFLLASLRYLTHALYDSILASGRLDNSSLRNVEDIISGVPSGDAVSAEQLPCRVTDDDFEPRFKAILRRRIVERCIYGVDLDDIAVELCRLSLWIETLDSSLPMTFLDHKIKCGNSLVGTWHDQFLHYPLAAWTREGGDKGHSNGVHFQEEAWTKAIAEKLKEAKSQITLQLDNELGFSDYLSPNEVKGKLEYLQQAMAKLHNLKVVDVKEQAKRYSEMRESKEFRELKASFDLWCALWFWPGEKLELAPMPQNFSIDQLSPEQLDILQQLVENNRFFHWELEFPEVFQACSSQDRGNAWGFDAILGNPPWDTFQPMSMEFFSNIDPLYRSYGKQEALRKQREYFQQSKQIEEDWLNYNASFSNGAHWYMNVAKPFDVPLGSAKNAQKYKETWLKHRRATSSVSWSHGYSYQGKGKAYGQKLFLECAYCLVKEYGRIGFIVPSGIYSDNGTKELRELFFNKCQWEWLFSFENRKKIFDIDSRFKFNPLIIQKGGQTTCFKAAFMRQNIDDWANADSIAFDYSVEQIQMFSPDSLSILELNSAQELKILSKIYAHSVLLGAEDENGWNVTIKQGDFNMTSDSHLFPPQETWRAWGYEPDEYSRWVKGPWKPVEELYALPEVAPHVHTLAVTAQPPYNTLRVKRCDIPVGIILSRDCTRWLRYDEIPMVTFTEASGKAITRKIGKGKKHTHTLEITGKAIAIPLYEGCMITHFDFSYQKYISGTGNKSVWENVPWEHKHIYSHYLMGENVYDELSGNNEKLAFRSIGCATNKRTLICASLTRQVSSHSLCVITGNKLTSVYPYSCQEHDKQGGCQKTSLNLLGCCLNSLVFDNCLRYRMCGTNISKFIMQECPVLSAKMLAPMLKIAEALNDCDKTFSFRHLDSNKYSLSRHERLRLMSISDAVIAKLYGLDEADYRFILSDCDWPVDNLSNKKFAAGLNPKGFWRVDREMSPELRQTVLSLVAFMELEKVIKAHDGDVQAGVREFLEQNNGEGWMLPETLRLADYGLGHDGRATIAQPVASVLGPRFYDWQLAQSPEEFRKECAVHAANLSAARMSEHLPDTSEQGRDGTTPQDRDGAAPKDEDVLVTSEQLTFDF